MSRTDTFNSLKIATPAIADTGTVRMGAMTPAFPAVRPADGTTDTKVRLGAMTPAFPPVRIVPGESRDSGKVRMGAMTPAF
jgi:hypothetical protein